MLISVVTPSFRQLNWLRLCAASVVDQKGVSHEHIVQDAGTGPELERWARTVSHLSLFVEKDDGMYDAINRGLRKARGEICSYLNCDEQLLPGALGEVHSFFDKNPSVEVLFGDVILTDIDGNPLSYRRTILPKLSHVRSAHLNTPSCATFFKRTLLDRGFFFDRQWKTIGDQVWVENLLRAGIRMATLRAPLAVFTFTGENLGATATSRQEMLRRRGQQTIAWPLRSAIGVAAHRIKKLCAGAYKFRHVNIEIYTLVSPNARQRHEGRVGFTWPGN